MESFEFPAVSHTRIDFWKQPQYTKNGMFWFTVAFGWLGLHHVLLRSPQTGFIFLITNFFTLGYPYFYDLIQLSTMTEEDLNTYGLAYPMGPLGLAQGMWLPPDDTIKRVNTGEFFQAPSTTGQIPQTTPINSSNTMPLASAPPPNPNTGQNPQTTPNNIPSKTMPLASASTVNPTTGQNPQTTPINSSITRPIPSAPPPNPNTGQNPQTTPINSSNTGQKPQTIPIKPSNTGQKLSVNTSNENGDPTAPQGDPKNPQVGGSPIGPPPSPWWFFLYSILIPIAPLAQILAGDKHNALIKFMFLTFIPLGWLLYGCSIIYDYFQMLVFPKFLFEYGASRFFPFTVLGYDRNGHSINITGNDKENPCPPSNFIIDTIKFFLSLLIPILYFINPAAAMALESAIGAAGTAGGIVGETAETLGKSAKQVIGSVVDTAVAVTDGVDKIKGLGGKIGTLQPKFPSVPQMPQMPQTPQIPQMPQTPQIPQTPKLEVGKVHLNENLKTKLVGFPEGTKIYKNPDPKNAIHIGGGPSKLGEDKTPLDWLVGGVLAAVIAGGFLLAGSRTLFQDGGKNDAVPII